MPITYDMESIRPCCGGLWKIQQLFGFLLGLGMLVVLWIIQPIETHPAANPMLGITLMCGIFWVFEVAPIYITALIPLLLMPLFEIVGTRIAAGAYWNQIQMLVIGTYLVDIALEEVHLPRRAALKLLLYTGVVQPPLLLLCFMVVCWVLAMVCNNIAVTLMITPFAIGLMNAAEEQARDEAAAASESEDTDDSDPHVDMSAEEVQRFANGLLLGIAFASTAGGMTTLTGTITNEVLYGVGTLRSEIEYGQFIRFAILPSIAVLLLAYFAIYVRYVHGLTLRTMTHEVLEAEYDELLKEIGPFSRDEAFVAVLQLSQFVLLMCTPLISAAQEASSELQQSYIGDPTLAAIPAICLFLIPSSVRPGQALLTWPAVHEKFDFGLLLLIGGGFAISTGISNSGLNEDLGAALAGVTESAHPFTMNLCIILVVSLCAQVFSTIGTATTLLPILYSVSQEAVRNPFALVLPATMACSMAFMLPTATPANVVVLAKSQELSRPLRIRDFFCTGLPLTLLTVVISGAIIFWRANGVFDSEAPFPKWACDNVYAAWVPVPGYTHGGVWVTEQGCAIDTQTYTTCKLWNGTNVNMTTFAPAPR